MARRTWGHRPGRPERRKRRERRRRQRQRPSPRLYLGPIVVVTAAGAAIQFVFVCGSQATVNTRWMVDRSCVAERMMICMPPCSMVGHSPHEMDEIGSGPDQAAEVAYPLLTPLIVACQKRKKKPSDSLILRHQRTRQIF